MKKNRILVTIILVITFILIGYFNNKNSFKSKLEYSLNATCEIKVVAKNDIYATGVNVEEGKVITSYHIISRLKLNEEDFKVYLKFNNNDTWILANIEKFDEANDLLLLKYDSDDSINDIKLADEKKIEMGTEIFGIGNENGQGLNLYKGIISNPYKVISKKSGNIGVIKTNIGINDGDSGGPVFNNKGGIGRYIFIQNLR